jgi:hypothetical protein
MKKQTAVEWLIEQVKSEKYIEDVDFNQAKEMEKQQIIDAQLNGQRASIEFAHEAKEEAEIYYQETFKSE